MAQSTEDDAPRIRRERRTEHLIELDVKALHNVARLHVKQIQHVATTFLSGERNQFPVGRKRWLRIDESQLLKIRIGRRANETGNALAGFRIREVQVGKHFAAQQAAIRDVGDQLAVRRDGRCHEQVGNALRPALGQERFRERARTVKLRDDGEVLGLHRLLPIVAQFVQGHTDFTTKRAIQAEAWYRVHDFADHFVAPLCTDKLPDRQSVAIREVLVRAFHHLLNARQRAVDDAVANPRIGPRMLLADREVLGEALHEPERWVDGGQVLQAAARPPTRKDVELKHVHHFVLQHVLKTVPVAAEEL